MSIFQLFFQFIITTDIDSYQIHVIQFSTNTTRKFEFLALISILTTHLFNFKQTDYSINLHLKNGQQLYLLNISSRDSLIRTHNPLLPPASPYIRASPTAPYACPAVR